jgi:hypothetical protein
MTPWKWRNRLKFDNAMQRDGRGQAVANRPKTDAANPLGKTERSFPLSLVVASPVQEELLDQCRHPCACDTAAALGVYQAED